MSESHHDKEENESVDDISEAEAQADTEVVSEAEAEADAEPAAQPAGKHHGGKPARGPKAWWAWIRAKRSRTIVASAMGVLLLLAGNVAATDWRYPVLGVFMTTSYDVTVRDTTTNQPVPKAKVNFGGASDQTDKDGHVKLKKVKLGHGDLKVSKSGYSDSTTKTLATIRPGKTTVDLKPNGIKVEVKVTNTITGGSVKGAEVKSGEASAISDDTGIAVISLPLPTNNTSQKLTLSKDGFTTADIDVQVKSGGAPVPAKLTPAGKVYFQSNRTGRIDIYSSNLDGTAAEVVLPGTGQEDSATGILPSINNSHVLAIVSSRDGRRGGSLHHDLFIFDTDSRKLTKIDQDVEFHNYRTWVGDTLVYTKSKIEEYYGECNDIKTYNAGTAKTAVFFSGKHDETGCPYITLGLRDGFLYSVKSAEAAKIGIFSAKISGNTKRISPTYSDNTVRRAKQTLLSEYYDYKTGNYKEFWDSIDLGNFSVSRLADGPSIEASRYYNDSPDGSKSVFIETRDGKSELFLTDGDGGNEKKLTSVGSVNQFVQWYSNDYIVFSSTKPGENALYVISTEGGTPVKVSDFYIGNQRTYGGGGNPYN